MLIPKPWLTEGKHESMTVELRRNPGSNRILVALLWAVGLEFLNAQDIEPRRWTPLPVGMSFIGAALVNTTGRSSLTLYLSLRIRQSRPKRS